MSRIRYPNERHVVDGIMIGDDHPVFIIAEIGINHNGSLDIAKKLIDGAIFAGCDAVKFQKRTPELCVPEHQWEIERDTPWGRMSYIDYKRRIEFGRDEYEEIYYYCKSRGVIWFASCWDEPSVDFIEQFDVPLYKGASASLTNWKLLQKMQATGKNLILSTGMSNMKEIAMSVNRLIKSQLLLAQCNSTYPAQPDELNLLVIESYRELWPMIPIGYSGHEVGLQATIAAVALGATFVERHITLDRAMWGTDQAASVEILGMHRLVRDIRVVEQALGDGLKRVYDSEKPIRDKLRG